ncbi:ECF RNA polymerase sigma factor SigM [bioreactor metagenome]|uniref:ECF RNA polymerase sigma factor SigM n=1 Tax=bioreactor metagenome TaxID=1076179 RepID=A0A644UDG4_9ZZZZ
MTEKEYNLCIDNFTDSAFRFLVKNIKDSDAAKDILQDTFTKLWEKREDVDFLKAKSYIFTSAYHTMINNIKYNSLKYNIPQTQTTTSNSYNDINEVLNEALEQLPQIQKASILLRDYEGYSYNEIGDILDLSQEQVKINIFRARVKLKEYIVTIDNVI